MNHKIISTIKIGYKIILAVNVWQGTRAVYWVHR